MTSTINNVLAAIMVTDGDLIGGEYIYTIDHNNVLSKPLADAEINTNFTSQNFFGVNFIVATTGQSFAQLVLHWDFSGTSLNPQSVELLDRTVLFTNTALERTEAITEYSINGTDWSVIDVEITPDLPINTPPFVNDDFETNTIAFGGTISEFYYRLTMTSLTDSCGTGDTSRCDASGAFSFHQNQWSRTNPPNETSFNAKFSAVPIPAALPLFGSAISVMGFMGLRKRKRTRKMDV